MDLDANFELWFFSRDGILQYGQDHGTGDEAVEEFYSALEHNVYRICEYGEKIGEYYTEDEALNALNDYEDRMNNYSLEDISIWDNDNQCWFN